MSEDLKWGSNNQQPNYSGSNMIPPMPPKTGIITAANIISFIMAGLSFIGILFLFLLSSVIDEVIDTIPINDDITEKSVELMRDLFSPGGAGFMLLVGLTIIMAFGLLAAGIIGVRGSGKMKKLDITASNLFLAAAIISGIVTLISGIFNLALLTTILYALAYSNNKKFHEELQRYNYFRNSQQQQQEQSNSSSV